MRAATRMPTPTAPAAGAARRGWKEHGHRCAWPGGARGAQRLRPRAQRWPVGSWAAASFRMRRGAQWPADPGSRLSECRRREFERDRLAASTRRLPAAKRRDAACRVAFLCLLLSAKRKKVSLPPGANPPATHATGAALASSKGITPKRCKTPPSVCRFTAQVTSPTARQPVLR